VGGLTAETEYHFGPARHGRGRPAVRSRRRRQRHHLSDGTFLFGLAVAPAYGDDEQLFTFTVSYSDPEGDVPVTHDSSSTARPWQ